MDTLVIACRTLENELNKSIQETGVAYDIAWIESGLHNVPKMLNTALQEALDSANGYSRVLLVMGYCGNSLNGLQNNDTTLIIPRVDDCISLLIGSYARRLAIEESGGTYFLTAGWLKGERTIWHEYEYMVEKYGEETAESTFDMMLRHYKYLALLDTGCFDKSSVEREVKGIARKLKLTYKEIPGTINYISKLLVGPWGSEDFLIVSPKSLIVVPSIKSEYP
jgi:hypothetical protein